MLWRVGRGGLHGSWGGRAGLGPGQLPGRCAEWGGRGAGAPFIQATGVCLRLQASMATIPNLVLKHPGVSPVNKGCLESKLSSL